ncbi:hypothetical protein Ciccas_008275 [Cichlidogyrus casuarinus]|uniref:Uncharacterized protein n=1 Tax=Cichlidogyrus casuarinus TaxID=1844966 RepID=A0ABD2Q0F2_9PLAT
MIKTEEILKNLFEAFKISPTIPELKEPQELLDDLDSSLFKLQNAIFIHDLKSRFITNPPSPIGTFLSKSKNDDDEMGQLISNLETKNEAMQLEINNITNELLQIYEFHYADADLLNAAVRLARRDVQLGRINKKKTQPELKKAIPNNKAPPIHVNRNVSNVNYEKKQHVVTNEDRLTSLRALLRAVVPAHNRVREPPVLDREPELPKPDPPKPNPAEDLLFKKMAKKWSHKLHDIDPDASIISDLSSTCLSLKEISLVENEKRKPIQRGPRNIVMPTEKYRKFMEDARRNCDYADKVNTISGIPKHKVLQWLTDELFETLLKSELDHLDTKLDQIVSELIQSELKSGNPIEDEFLDQQIPILVALSCKRPEFAVATESSTESENASYSEVSCCYLQVKATTVGFCSAA